MDVEEKFLNILVETFNLFTPPYAINSSNKNLALLLEGYECLDSYLYLGLSEKPKIAYQKIQDTDKRCAMLINQSQNWPLFAHCITEYYGLQLVSDDNLKKFTNIITTIKPWSITCDKNEIEQEINKRIVKINEKINNFSNSVVRKIENCNFSKYDFFLVFGCPSSTDIDIVLFVSENGSKDNSIDFKVNSVEFGVPDINKIYSELALIGYDCSKELDVNQVTYEIKNGFYNITNTNGAGKEIQNSIYYTCELHKQVYPIPNFEPITVPILFKIRETCKYFLDNFKIFVDAETYKEYRKQKSRAYDG